MEHAKGVQLHQMWPSMTCDERITCISAIYRKVKEMVDINFAAYGSMYFRGIEVNSDVVELDEHFCIWPHCGSIYWQNNSAGSISEGEFTSSRGPCA